MGPTDYQRRSPEYAQYYYARAAKDNERAYEQQQRDELAKWAKTSGYLGNEGQQGLPSANPALQTQPGTGVYAENFDPQRREMMLRNRALLMSGNKALQEQGMNQMGSMQTSRNTGINTIDLERWKKDNIPEKPTNPYANVYTGSDNRKYGTNLNTGLIERLPGDGAPVREGSSTQLSIGADGAISFFDGTGSPAPMGKPTTNLVEKDAYDAVKSLDRLDNLNTGFDEQFLTYEGKIGAWGLDKAAKLGIGLSEEQESYLIKYSEFKADAVDNMAKYIQSISGAAVTEQEAKRLKNSLPDIDDSAPKFKAKMRAARRRAKMAIIRANYMKATGGNPLAGEISLSSMETIYNKRRAALRDKYIGMLNTGGMTDAQKLEAKERIKAQVKEDLKNEFGA